MLKLAIKSLPAAVIATALGGLALAQPRSAPDDLMRQAQTMATDRIIIKFKKEGLPKGLDIAAERADLEKAHGLARRLTIQRIDAQVYQVPEGDTAQEVVDRIRKSKKDLIEYIEIDAIATPAYMPNDPYAYGANAWHLPKISAPTAWDSNRGEGVTIAIVDSGVDCTHPDLAARCVPGWNTASNNSDTSDIHGHGTAVAGTAASTGDNNHGGAGVAFNAKIMPVRVTNDPTNNAFCSTIANGIIYAADHGAKIASNSYHLIGCTVVTDAANYMASKGGLYIRSAGNDTTEITTVNDENVIIASATDQNDARTSWSNYGNVVDVAAPGIDVYCTWPGGAYYTCWGTSFSTPITAGVLAMVWTANPKLTVGEAKSVLFSSADDLGAPGWDKYFGHGRVNAAKAVATALAIQGTVDTVPPSTPTGLRSSNVTDRSATISWLASSDNVLVSGYNVFRNGHKIASTSSTSLTDSALSALSTYSYTVSAFDSAGNVSASSAPLSVTTEDILFGIVSYAVSSKTSSGASIAVSLTKPGTVIVKYGTTTSLTQQVQSTTSSTQHVLSLSNLSAATTYYYQVIATDGAGKAVTSPISSFKTSNARGGGGKNR